MQIDFKSFHSKPMIVVNDRMNEGYHQCKRRQRRSWYVHVDCDDDDDPGEGDDSAREGEEDLVVHKYCKPIHTYVGTTRE